MSSHQDVLQLLGCSDLYTLVDPDFLAEFGLSRPAQYGMVCTDVRAKQFELEALGCGPFVYAKTKGPNWREHGEPRDVDLEVAMGYSNGQQIELLGAGTNTNLYRPVIPVDGGLALHHVCVFQKGLAELEARLNGAGFASVASGHVGISGLYTTCFCYLDTRARLGFYLELAEYKTLGMQLPPTARLIGFLGRLQRRFTK